MLAATGALGLFRPTGTVGRWDVDPDVVVAAREAVDGW